jgi:tRNA pseudouridine38-40 synthase
MPTQDQQPSPTRSSAPLLKNCQLPIVNCQSPARRNIKLVIAYDGFAYHGWQRQAQGFITVQQCVEEAAARVVGHPVAVKGAGRTDAGVHATGQVANFHTTSRAIPLRGLRRAINAKLPRDITVRSACEVSEAFHASTWARGKTYRYRIHVAPDRPVLLAHQVYHYWRTLDADAMRAAGQRLLGRHDFRGLATSAEVRQDTVRRLWRCDVVEEGPEIHITVEGDGFLYNMVRNIVGTLIGIGRGQWGPDRIDRILATCDRRQAGPTAPPDGLCLVAVHYPPGLGPAGQNEMTEEAKNTNL